MNTWLTWPSYMTMVINISAVSLMKTQEILYMVVATEEIVSKTLL